MLDEQRAHSGSNFLADEGSEGEERADAKRRARAKMAAGRRCVVENIVRKRFSALKPAGFGEAIWVSKEGTGV